MRAARIAAVLMGLTLAVPGAASGQTPSGQGGQAPDTGQSAPPLSTSAPSSSDAAPAAKPAAKPAAAPARRLPSTGADAGLLALLGTGLVLTGAGLRLRLRELSALPE
ncbi:MAG: LPXTG cell wall anchor domain-containing protein [Actinomycetota bacterium]|nr:LPXTG cell wall anchor domain-containing protein [Actinomycetota bacterium]